MKILIIDNNIDRDAWGCEDFRRLIRTVQKGSPGATIQVRRAPEGDLPKSPEGFDRVIVSGSRTSARQDAPWIDTLHEFIRRTVDSRKPFLGVCYGHQALVRALAGKEAVRRGEEAEFGWTQIEVLEADGIMQGLPKTFHTFSAHFEEVSQLPGALKLLARSPACAIQAVRVRELPVFGIQFHPEKDAEAAKKTFAERLQKGTPAHLLHPRDSDKLYDPAIGETLFRNFLAL